MSLRDQRAALREALVENGFIARDKATAKAPGARTKAAVAIVDLDHAARQAFGALLAADGFIVRSFDSIEEMAASGQQNVACLILDFHGQKQNVLELLEQLSRRGIDTPVIIATAHGDVKTAVEAMRCGAVDFIQKSSNAATILASVRTACTPDDRYQEFSTQARARRLISLLTDREREVLQLLAAGRSNKGAAEELGLSSRTVELYRARIKSKFGTKSMSKVVSTAILAA